MQNKDSFFTNAERSLIVKEILDRTSFITANESNTKIGKSSITPQGTLCRWRRDSHYYGPKPLKSTGQHEAF